jgi:hypothetical protein
MHHNSLSATSVTLPHCLLINDLGAIYNLAWDGVTKRVIGTYQHGSQVLSIDPLTGRTEQVGVFPSGWCLLAGAGAFDAVKRQYFSLFEDDSGMSLYCNIHNRIPECGMVCWCWCWLYIGDHRLIQVDLVTKSTTIERLPDGLNPIIVHQPSHAILGFNDGGIWLWAHQGNLTRVFDGLTGNIVQSGWALDAATGRLMIIFQIEGIVELWIFSIDNSGSKIKMQSRTPLPDIDDARYIHSTLAESFFI